RQPPSEESSLAGAALPIYLSLLSWSGCDQQCCRASFATAGGGAQELGWESNRKRSACASRAHQHPANGPTAREEPAGSADRLTGGERPGQDSRPGAAHPRNTSGFVACASTSERGGLRSSRAVENRVCTSAGVGGSLRYAEVGGRCAGVCPAMTLGFPDASPREERKRLPVSLRFCGRLFTGPDLELMRVVVYDYLGLAGMELASTVCELLGWQGPNGGV